MAAARLSSPADLRPVSRKMDFPVVAGSITSSGLAALQENRATIGERGLHGGGQLLATADPAARIGGWLEKCDYFGMEGVSGRKPSATQSQAFRALSGVVLPVIQLDRVLFGPGNNRINVTVFHDTPGPDNAKLLEASWHADSPIDNNPWTHLQHPDKLHQRVWLLRTAPDAAPIATEFIRSSRVLTEQGTLHPLLENIERRHKLPAMEYKAWEQDLRSAGLLTQPPANHWFLFTLESVHKSYRPAAPTPSTLVRVTVKPRLKRQPAP